LNKFYDDMFKGNQIKELIKILLEKSGYLVLPYGYESTLSDIKKKLRDKGSKNSRTARRIRTSPDLLVYDGNRKDVMLVEVKMRRTPKKTSIKYLRITNYKEFWDDSILIVVIPKGNVFYAQKIDELEIKEEYDANTDFEKIEDVFTRTQAQDVSHFKDQALHIMTK
jgi:Holliday junction resolvase